MSDKEERITGIGTYTIVGRAQRLGSERWSWRNKKSHRQLRTHSTENQPLLPSVEPQNPWKVLTCCIDNLWVLSMTFGGDQGGFFWGQSLNQKGGKDKDKLEHANISGYIFYHQQVTITFRIYDISFSPTSQKFRLLFWSTPIWNYMEMERGKNKILT
jgi:hypothetical protein